MPEISFPKTASGSGARVNLVTTSKSWIEGKALVQLEKTAELEGMVQAVGLPDLHPGKGYPIGAAFVTKGCFYPALAGGDIGCGVGLWQTGLKTHKLKLDRWSRKLAGLETPWEGDHAAWLADFNVSSGDHDMALGTIGGGNHFAELQKVDTIYDEEAFTALKLEKASCQLLVHSGSRGLGQALLRAHWEDHGARSLEEGSSEAVRYEIRHDHALRWARANRALIARRFMEQIGTEGCCACDISHNLISRKTHEGETLWLHRKGAAESDNGPVMLPGSRGTFSYLVQPVGDGTVSAWSLAHGAGRKWKRGAVKGRLSHKYSVADLQQTKLGSRVICEDKELLYDEAPQAYKDIDQVIADLVAHDLVKPVARFAPLITYKMRRR